MCVSASDTNANGARVALRNCYQHGTAVQFPILAQSNAISNALPELNTRCSGRGRTCRFDCPDLWTVGQQAEAWIDGTRLACGRTSSNALYCVTAAPPPRFLAFAVPGAAASRDAGNATV
ncbi:hypothetical protein GGF32_004031 [Allomyces javanicus]|nr:hypothetical protein GGF32_004031 [Allomyces javanicus]